MLNGKNLKNLPIDTDNNSVDLIQKKNNYNDLDPNDLYYLTPLKTRGYYKNKKWKEIKIRDFKDIIEVLKKYKSFFSNNNCLEINCGDGQFCFNYYFTFLPKKYIGIDFSFNLLEKCLDIKENLVDIEELKKNSDEKEFLKFLEDCPINLLINKNMKHFEELYKNKFIKEFYKKLIYDLKEKTDLKKMEKNLIFKLKNFFSYQPKRKFDVVFSLSFFKYFHFTFGDSIIEKIILKIKSHLENKGILVLDLVSVKFYKKFLKKNPKLKNDIKLMPEDIVQLLIEKYKFIKIHCEEIVLKKYTKKIYIFLSHI